MIHRLRGRSAFRRLAAEGTRRRGTALWCIWCPDPDSRATSVAFAIGRALGSATTRNRLRRRLRALVAELDRERPLSPGMLVIGAHPGAIELTFDQLRQALRHLLVPLIVASGTTPGCKR